MKTAPAGSQIDSADSPFLDQLCEQIRELPPSDNWPTEKITLLDSAGVYRWFVPTELGGLGWSSSDIVRGYLKLSSSCLTTTFILTQRVAALRRICSSPNAKTRDAILPNFMDGKSVATVGISHLTTSQQHLGEPALRAEMKQGGFEINGYSPWVTGAGQVDRIFMGAQLNDGRQILFLINTDVPGMTIKKGFDLMALSGSQTGPVHCDQIFVSNENVLFGPAKNVLAATGTATGSFQTSSLAIGLSRAALDFIKAETENRPDLEVNYQALASQYDDLENRLLTLASGVPICSNEELRSEANSFALRVTQSAMVAAKGSGFVNGHPVGQWCREAFFFLVWSCPQAVLQAHLCEFAGIES
ncbi:MAG: acyl-CoA dehydrogenase family protein [Planctomycetota bacterium]